MVETFVVLGTVYLAAMLTAAFMLRISPPGWKPAGWTPAAAAPMVTTRNVHPSQAIRTPQFYMLSGVLLLNVTAGIGEKRGLTPFSGPFSGAIFGRVLLAHSCAAVLGPMLVNYLREFQLANGVPPAQAYNVTMYIMAGLLILGFFVNRAVTSVDDDRYMDNAVSG